MNQTANITKTILIVKEHPSDQQLFKTLLEGEGYDCLIATDGLEALRLLQKVTCSLLIFDARMADMTGVELLTEVRYLYPDLAVMLLSHQHQNGRPHLATHGKEPLPFDGADILNNITTTLQRREQDKLSPKEAPPSKQLIDKRTQELHLARQESMSILSRAAEFRDDETAQHTVRIGLYSELLAQKIGLHQHHCDLIRHASPLHDVGKIGIPDEVLLKPGRLNDAEFKVIQTHCEIGSRILAETKSEVFQLGKVIAYTHHEKFNGTGYPHGLKAARIPLEGRIVAICDVFDALTTRRIYKEAIPPDKAMTTMKKERGNHFDPELLDLFMTHIDAVWQIRARHKDKKPHGYRRLRLAGENEPAAEGIHLYRAS